jgi:4-hydroxy-tetrahydrodipicolinate reductase
MLNISILGATGKVGAALRQEIASADDLALGAAVASGRTGQGVPLAVADFSETDVIVDFSAPAATLDLIDSLAGRAVPLVVGTTGFSAAQTARLIAEGANRPILIGANLTEGFEAFAAAAAMLADAVPDARMTLREVYNAAKKPVASGTTMRLREDLGRSGRPVEVEILRIGDTPGINTIVLDYGVATLELQLTVHARAAYARGALDAARWLAGRPNGAYRPQDMLTDRQGQKT